MKIAIVNLTGGGLSGGYYKYLVEIVPILLNYLKPRDLALFVPPKFMTQLDEIMAANICYPCENTYEGRRNLKKNLIEQSPDVIFYPSLQGLNIEEIPSVYMIHNMEALARPIKGNGVYESLKNIARYQVAKIGCRQATRILAVSGYVQNFLVSRWQIPPEKIGVVYHGVCKPPPMTEMSRPQKIDKDGGKRFLFTAGSIRPARGLEDIIKALPILAAWGISLPLVIGGSAAGGGAAYERYLQRLAQRLGVKDQVIWAGHLTMAEMSWCYHQAALFVMTSRVEACPNVALEAMSHGALCLAADNPPLPEIFHDSAIFYQPLDHKGLAWFIHDILNWPIKLQEKKRYLSSRRAKDFTWTRTAEQTIEELQRAILLKHNN